MDPQNIPEVRPDTINFYIPIETIERNTREVIGTATAEVEDKHRTIFRYAGSKDAFTRWRGNIREMHDPKKAVGRALEIKPDDANKRIIVRAMISKGAEDTWQKILDGVLTGFSVGGVNGKWSNEIIDGRSVPILESYDVNELSLVDNPSNPSANDLVIVRSDGLASDVLASETEPAQNPGGDNAVIERAGARLSADTRGQMHAARDAAMNAARSMMTNCNCEECSGIVARIDPQNDDERNAITEIVRSAVQSEIERQLAPSIQRVNALLARSAQDSGNTEITRRVDAQGDALAEIKKLIERVANQPASGGPVLHAGAKPIDKTLATDGRARQPQVTPETLEYLRAQGVLNTLDSQVAAASLLLQSQPMRG